MTWRSCPSPIRTRWAMRAPWCCTPMARSKVRMTRAPTAAPRESEPSPPDRRPVLCVGHMLHPGDGAAVEGLPHCDVDHPRLGSGAMPMLLSRRDPHRVAGANLAHRSAPQLDAADAGDDMQGLA